MFPIQPGHFALFLFLALGGCDGAFSDGPTDSDTGAIVEDDCAVATRFSACEEKGAGPRVICACRMSDPSFVPPPADDDLDRRAWPFYFTRKGFRRIQGTDSCRRYHQIIDEQKYCLDFERPLNHLSTLYPAPDVMPPDGKYSYVYRAEDHQIVIRPVEQEDDPSTWFPTNGTPHGAAYPAAVRHSQFMSGFDKPVWCAGALTVVDGAVHCIDNGSGHFRPSATCLDYVEVTLGHGKIPTRPSGVLKLDKRADEAC